MEDESILPPDDDPFNVTPLDVPFFEEIGENIRTAERLEKEEKELRRKIEKLRIANEKGEEIIKKGKEKIEALRKQRDFLQSCVDKKDERIRNAVQYWEDYGLAVEQVSLESDPFEYYNFIFSKLPPKKAAVVLNGQSGDCNTTARLNQSLKTSTTCTIGLKHFEKRLEVVEQSPEVINPEALKLLNERLTGGQCLNKDNDHVDWKLAMLMIKGDLIKALKSTATSSSTTVSATPLVSESEAQSRTCEHPPAETSSHTCT